MKKESKGQTRQRRIVSNYIAMQCLLLGVDPSGYLGETYAGLIPLVGGREGKN